MPRTRTRPGRLAALAAIGLIAIQVAAAMAASPGTNPFTEAVVHFNIDNGTIESVQARGDIPADYVPSSIFYFFCSPPGDSETNTVASGSFTVAPDGALAGTCHATRSATDGSGYVTDVVKDGTLSGQYDLAAQTVAFHFEGTSQYTFIQPPACTGTNCGPQVSVFSVVVDGPATAVVGDRAEGTEHYTFSCSPATVCYVSSQIGTGGFAVQFLPYLPSQAPEPGGGGGSGGTSDSNFILLLILAGASAAVIAAAVWFRMRGRGKPTGPAPAGVAGAVGSDRSGGFEDQLSYGEGAEVASPAAPKAYEALVVAQSSADDEPLISSPSDQPPVVDIDDFVDGETSTPDTPDSVREPRGPESADTPSPAEPPPPTPPPDSGEAAIKDEAMNILDAAPLPPPAGSAPPTQPPDTGQLTPPKPGEPGTMHMEGEGWAGTHSDTPDAFAEDWVTSTGVIGTPGSVRPTPSPAAPKTPEEAIKDEATNIIDAVDTEDPKA